MVRDRRSMGDELDRRGTPPRRQRQPLPTRCFTRDYAVTVAEAAVAAAPAAPASSSTSTTTTTGSGPANFSLNYRPRRHHDLFYGSSNAYLSPTTTLDDEGRDRSVLFEKDARSREASVGDGEIQTTTTTITTTTTTGYTSFHTVHQQQQQRQQQKQYQPPAAVAATSSSSSSGSTIRKRGTSLGHPESRLYPLCSLSCLTRHRSLSLSIFPTSDVTGTESGIDPERPPRPHPLSQTVLTG